MGLRRRPTWYYRQSAAVPCRAEGGTIEVLLITSRSGRRWGIPKGIVELVLSPAESARKEAYEDAGVLGSMSSHPIGVYEYRKWGGVCTVDVYMLFVERVLEEWPEAWRRRRWLTVEGAMEAIEKPSLREIVARVPEAFRR
jgi:phosphohistidine phosphatase